MNVGGRGQSHASSFGVARPDLGWVPSLRYLSRRRELLKIASRWRGKARVLEIGCGAGAFLHDLTQMGHEVTGVETSSEARALALSLRDSENGAWAIHDDVGQLDGRFDVIGAFDVIEHIDDDVDTLVRWQKLACAGAALCISVPAHRHWWGPGDVWAGHFRRYDRMDVDALLRKSGWDVEEVVPYGFPIASLTEWIGRIYYSRSLSRNERCRREGATAKSGIDREPYLRLWPVLGSVPFRWAIRCVLSLQSISWPEQWSAGYIVVARLQR